METEKLRSNYRQAIVIGIGLALSPIHNRWLTDLVTTDGVVGFFLPALGTAIWLMASLFFVAFNWRDLDIGDKRIFIPLLVIVGAIGLSGITADRWQDKISPLLIGISLFALYLVARKLGKDMFLPLAIGVGIASVGLIVYALLNPGFRTGGFIFERNYEIAAGFIMLGASLVIHKYRLQLISLALVALFLSGSPEAVFASTILLAVITLRRDWAKKAALVLAPVTIVAIVYFAMGYGQVLYSFTAHVVTSCPGIRSDSPLVATPTTPSDGKGTITIPKPNSVIISEEDLVNSPIEYRLYVITNAMANIKPFGEGYNLTGFQKLDVAHNTPLVIVQQLGYPGIFAGIAWLWISVWCLIKTRWKHTWVLILALSVFDHFTWTQLAPWWWAVIGVSTVVSKN